MADIKIVDKIVAPNEPWSHISLDGHDETLTPCVYRVTFNRTYSYIWVKGDELDYDRFGIALTYGALQRAAVLDEEGAVKKFNTYADGVMPIEGNLAFAIAMGPRQTFYLLSNHAHPSTVTYNIHFAAQDVPICPFAFARPWA